MQIIFISKLITFHVRQSCDLKFLQIADEPLKTVMNQLCANITGHLVMKGLYQTLQVSKSLYLFTQIIR